MNDLNFVKLMNQIYTNLMILKNNQENTEIYNEVEDELLSLNDLINDAKIPNDVYSKVVKFHHGCSLIHASLNIKKEKNNYKNI